MSLAVSDHAVLRYMERVCGLDTAAVKAEILNGLDDRTHAALLATGGTTVVRYRKRHRVVLAVRGGVVTSILPHR